MPHLAPMFWILFPLVLSILIYYKMMILHFISPMCFKMNSTNTLHGYIFNWG